MPAPQRLTAPTADVLRVLLDSPDPVWGLQIVKLIERPTGSVYPILARLEDAGWIAGDWEADADHPGPRRRLYRLTAEGVPLARTAVADYAARAAVRAAALRPARGATA